MLVLWIISVYLGRFAGVKEQLQHTPEIFAFSAVLSVVAALYSLTLPSTPPSHIARSPFTFIEALRLLRQPTFLALIVVTFLVSIVSQFQMMLQLLFYADEKTGLGLDIAAANRAASVCQILEVGLFPALGYLIHRFGLRRVLLVGVCVWPFRFAVYALGHPPAFVIGFQIFHGVNVVLAAIALQIAIDAAAPRTIRASAQALYATVSAGVGALVGQLTCGAVLSRFALVGGGHAWRYIYLVPLVISLVAASVLFVFYRDSQATPKVA
jgi:hypothetical protein